MEPCVQCGSPRHRRRFVRAGLLTRTSGHTDKQSQSPRLSSTFITRNLTDTVLLWQYRADGIKARDKFVRPLQDLSASMSLAAQSNYGKTSRDFKSSSILEISTIQESFRTFRASLCSFSCYVPQQFIQSQIRQHADIGLSISRCQGTVLFSDIASFTSISESLEPKRLHQVRVVGLQLLL